MQQVWYEKGSGEYIPEDLVDLVEHLGGSQVVRGKVGVLAGGTLDTIQLFLGSWGEHKEAHASCEVCLGNHGCVSWSAGATNREKAETKDESFEDKEDKEICEIESEDLRCWGCSGKELHGILNHGHFVLCSSRSQDCCHNCTGIYNTLHFLSEINKTNDESLIVTVSSVELGDEAD